MALWQMKSLGLGMRCAIIRKFSETSFGWRISVLQRAEHNTHRVAKLPSARRVAYLNTCQYSVLYTFFFLIQILPSDCISGR